ncbi:MAG: glycosyltransferase [candidate division Zixibacteria bacterium]|nr:glycosyltransferase [candidate division Zixibacteria bacterium]
MKRKIKLLHIINELEIGGAEVLLSNIAQYLDKDRYEIHVAYLDKQGTLAGDIEQNGGYVYDLSMNGRKHPFIFFRVLSIIKSLKPDIVHVHLLLASVLGRIAGRIAGVPVLIATRHYHINENSGDIRFILDRFTARFDDALVGVSDITTDRMKNIEKLKAKRFITIYNGVDTSFFNGETIEGKGMVIGSVGNLYSHKGYEYQLRILKKVAVKFPGIKLEIIGEGPERANLDRLSGELGVAEKVEFLGRCSQEEVRQKLTQWKVFMMTSHDESFGIVAAEAMAMKTPVVAFRVGGLPEVIREGIDGFLIDKGNINEFTKKLKYLLENDAVRREMGEAGRERAVDKFSITGTVESYDELYVRLLKEKQLELFKV